MTDTGEERAYDNWAKYRSEWWARYFTGDLVHFWRPQLDQAEVDKDGYRWVSRSDVFAMAASESEHRELHTAVAAYVWGSVKTPTRWAVWCAPSRPTPTPWRTTFGQRRRR